MSDIKTLIINSTVRQHTTKLGTLGLIESKILATIIGKQIVEVKYQDR